MNPYYKVTGSICVSVRTDAMDLTKRATDNVLLYDVASLLTAPNPLEPG